MFDLKMLLSKSAKGFGTGFLAMVMARYLSESALTGYVQQLGEMLPGDMGDMTVTGLMVMAVVAAANFLKHKLGWKV